MRQVRQGAVGLCKKNYTSGNKCASLYDVVTVIQIISMT